MSDILEIKYRCQHPSCVVNCREGVITVDEEVFKELSSSYSDEALFRSPKGVCRMGFAQPFKVISMGNAGDTDYLSKEARARAEAEDLASDPLIALKAEHKVVLKLLEKIEGQIKKRDIDGLWQSTVELENDVTLHSIKKEEEVLFPLLGELIPLGEGLVAIVIEDHREFMSLLSAFRTGLAAGDILDGIIGSVIVNLRSHIMKEDGEFFDLVNKGLRDLDEATKTRLSEAFLKVEREFKPVQAGDRLKARAKFDELIKKRGEHDEMAAEARKDTAESAGGCCH
ncbi:MAG: hemerythrin domain-containing protein [Deltaproteobacteria bacterium]|nr:hemerythrin domain-containing protein [Deltaproteobacteria bacterium]